jgi:nucleotide-binding universal stress UspA family protein
VRAAILPTDKGKASTIEEGLPRHHEKTKASLLVMGAYTSSRFRELILGGATRDVFDHASLSVLMAH